MKKEERLLLLVFISVLFGISSFSFMIHGQLPESCVCEGNVLKCDSWMRTCSGECLYRGKTPYCKSEKTCFCFNKEYLVCVDGSGYGYDEDCPIDCTYGTNTCIVCPAGKDDKTGKCIEGCGFCAMYGYPATCGEEFCVDKDGKVTIQQDVGDIKCTSCIPCESSLCQVPGFKCVNGRCVPQEGGPGGYKCPTECCEGVDKDNTYPNICVEDGKKLQYYECVDGKSEIGKLEPCPEGLVCPINPTNVGQCVDLSSGSPIASGGGGEPQPPVSTGQAPDAPTNLKADPRCDSEGPGDTFPKTITFRWDAPASGAHHYKVRVYKSLNANDYLESQQPVMGTSEEWPNFPAGTDHRWYVVAYGDEAGTAFAYSESQVFNTNCNPLPGATDCPCTGIPGTEPGTGPGTLPTNPSDFTCEKIIKWSPYAEDDFKNYGIQYSLVPGFDVEMFTDHTKDPIVPAERAYYILTKFPPDLKFYYRVLMAVKGINKPGCLSFPDVEGGISLCLITNGSFTIPKDKCNLVDSEPIYNTCVCSGSSADVITRTDGTGEILWVYKNIKEDTKCDACFYTNECPEEGDPVLWNVIT